LTFKGRVVGHLHTVLVMLYFMKANEQNVAAFLQDLKRLHIYMYLKKYKWRV